MSSSSVLAPHKCSVEAFSIGRARSVLEGVLAAAGTPEFVTVGCAAAAGLAGEPAGI
jgi:hypothetical protein